MKRPRRELCFWVCLAISLLASLGLAWCTAVEYAAAGVSAGSNPENDLGDAPDSSNSYAVPMRAYPDGTAAHYPTVYGKSAPPYGPIHWRPKAVAYLGRSVTLESEADLGPDEEGVNNIQPLDESSNREGGDDGVRLPLVLPTDQAATLEYTVTVVNPLPGVMYANVWFDWNRDGDWDDTLSGPNGAPAPEWAVQNQAVALTAVGPLRLTTPAFVCWHPAGNPVPIWMRITLSELPWSAGGAGSAGGCGPKDGYLYGETEDYYLSPVRQAGAGDYQWLDPSAGSARAGQLQAQAVKEEASSASSASIWTQGAEDPVWKWTQWPDMTADALAIRVDSTDAQKRVVADDFECTSLNCLAGVRLWGLWKNDQKGQITKIRLRLHDNDPAGTQGPDPTNTFPKPGPEIRWQKEFGPGQFEEMLYYVQGTGQWWWDPAVRQLTKPAATGLWQITIDLGPDDGFVQEGQPGSPHVYWLAVEVETIGGQLGWQARRPLDHFQGAGVWDMQPTLPRIWQELSYPAGHPSANAGQAALDLAFGVKYRACTSAPTAQPGSATQCPVVSTQCPAVSTSCPAQYTYCPPSCTAAATVYPAAATQCPTVLTQCPVVSTTCPATATACPGGPTQCPAVTTQCPTQTTQCPTQGTSCPVVGTQCPPQSTSCPPCTTAPGAPTQCPIVDTYCPHVATQCPEFPSHCPVMNTMCPATPVGTQCPADITICPEVSTQCPVVNTQCPTYSTLCPTGSTHCPMIDTQCPPLPTQCPLLTTQCYPMSTICPVVSTQCPVVDTQCPPAVSTICPAVSTQCPVVVSACPATPVATQCPPKLTRCPLEETVCPILSTHCPVQIPTCLPTEHFGSVKETKAASSGSVRAIEIRRAPGAQALLRDALSGRPCPIVETTVPIVVGGGR